MAHGQVDLCSTVVQFHGDWLRGAGNGELIREGEISILECSIPVPEKEIALRSV